VRGETGAPDASGAPVWRRWLSLAVTIALFAVALVILRHLLADYSLAQIVASLHQIGWPYIWASLGLTALGYGALVGYDYLSLRLAGHPIAVLRMWSASFVSHAVQNSAPMSIVAGGGLRYRLFSRLGITGAETANVVAGNLLTFVIGLFAVAGLSFVIAPIPIPALFHLPITSLRPLGALFLALVIAALLFAEFGSGHVRLWRWKFDLPHGSLLRWQLLVSIADWLLSSTALYVLLCAAGPVSYSQFLSGYLLVEIVTQIFPLPGGIGVFEAAMLLLRPQGLSAPFETVALLVYRVVYFLVPLFFASAILALQASNLHKRHTSPAVRVAREVTPHLFAVLTFVSGLVLLASTTLPDEASGFGWLGHVLRLAVIEGSHFIGSLVGTGLLLLAFGLERRLRSAFHLTVGLLLLGIPAAILRSVDAPTAALLTVLLLLLLTARREFDRTIPVSDEPLNGGWMAAVVAAVVGLGWLGIYMRVRGQYTSSLWWRFELNEDAPRTLRVAIGVLTAGLIFVVTRLMSRARRPKREKRGRDVSS